MEAKVLPYKSTRLYGHMQWMDIGDCIMYVMIKSEWARMPGGTGQLKVQPAGRCIIC